MKTIQIEITMDDLLCIMFALRKAIHYTEFFDPTYWRYFELPDKQQHLQKYREMLLKFIELDGILTFDFDELIGTDMEEHYHVFNAKIVEHPDEDDNDFNGKGKQ